MKDSKFICLLIMITIIAVINLTWLAKLQSKYNTLSQVEVSELNDGLFLTVGAVKTRQLYIVDEKNNPRMVFETNKNITSIDIWDADGKPKLDYLDEGPGKEGTFTLHSTDGAKISLRTFGHSPIIEVVDKAGKTAIFGSN